MAGQNNYNKMAYNGAQPGPIMNQPLSANQIQHQVNAQRHRKPNLLSIENNPRNRFKKFKKQNIRNRLNIDKMSVQCTVIYSRLDPGCLSYQKLEKYCRFITFPFSQTRTQIVSFQSTTESSKSK